MGGYLNCFVAAPGPLEGCQNCLNVAIAPVARLQSCDAATGPVVGHLSRYVAVSLPLDPWRVARTIFCPLGLWLVSSFFGGGGYWAQTAFVLAELFFWTSVLDLTPPTLGWLSYIFFCWFWAFRSRPLEGGTVRNLVLMTQGPWAVLGLLVCNMIICCACISGFPFSCECACVWSPGFPGPPGLVGVSRWEAGHTLEGGTHTQRSRDNFGWLASDIKTHPHSLPLFLLSSITISSLSFTHSLHSALPLFTFTPLFYRAFSTIL